MKTAPIVVCLFAGFAVQSELGAADARQQRRLAWETRVEQAHAVHPKPRHAAVGIDRQPHVGPAPS